MPDRVELIADLKQLCVVFGHIEKLVILAVSIHHKLSDAPRLSGAIFQEYFDFYQPKMGTGSTSSSYDKVFADGLYNKFNICFQISYNLSTRTS